MGHRPAQLLAAGTPVLARQDDAVGGIRQDDQLGAAAQGDPPLRVVGIVGGDDVDGLEDGDVDRLEQPARLGRLVLAEGRSGAVQQQHAHAGILAPADPDVSELEVGMAPGQPHHQIVAEEPEQADEQDSPHPGDGEIEVHGRDGSRRGLRGYWQAAAPPRPGGCGAGAS